MTDALEPGQPAEMRLRLPAAVRLGFSHVRQAAPRELVLGVVFETLSALALVVVLVSGREVVESLTSDTPATTLRQVLPETLLLGAGLAASGISGVLVGEYRQLVGILTTRETQRRIVDVATTVPYEKFETSEFHDLLQRASSEGTASSHQIVTSVLALTNVALTSASIVVVLVVTVPQVLVALVAVAVPFALAARAAARLGYRVAYELTPNDRLRAYLYRALTGRDAAKEVRVLGLGEPVAARWDDLNEDRIRRVRTMVSKRALYSGAASVASAALVAGVLIVLVRAAVRGDLALADAAIAIVALQQLASRIRSAASSSGSLQRSALFLHELQRLFDEPRLDTAQDGLELEPAPVTLDGVGFTYPGTTRQVLHDVTMTIAPGRVIGLVGVSGSGKTTLAKLVANLYDVTEGTIRFGEQDLREIPRPLYWSHVSPVFQDFVRYELTARENIEISRLGKAGGADEVTAAAAAAGADEFLRNLPDGYETFLSRSYDGGADLSIGQWQRLAVARAFFRDAPVLIFDEPASALDARSEHELFETVRDLASDRAVLLVSHRFSTIKLADEIVVLDAGHIVERGTHAELIDANGLYAELYRLQVVDD